ncbi:hypothetical protein BGZ94_008618 [Podila epigama]|nr:hypothetical protein BGZ94_008618 [Podila epigama]
MHEDSVRSLEAKDSGRVHDGLPLEVRVSVSNRDDATLPYNTFRVWFLGILFTAVISFVNQFFHLRSGTMYVSVPLCAILTLPLGHLMAAILPTREFTFIKWRFTLNPGPFSIKEHALISMFGFGMAGILHRFLVRPPRMMWPSVLVNVALFRSLHAHKTAVAAADEKYNDMGMDMDMDMDMDADMKKNVNVEEDAKEEAKGEEKEREDEQGQETGRISMMRFFAYLAFASFVYHWLPFFAFPLLASLSLACWIKPDNVILAQITGSGGLGLGTIALDWSTISFTLPLTTPLFVQFNILIGVILFAYIIVPLVYYSDAFGSKQLPIFTARLFTSNGTPFMFSSIYENGHLDEVAFAQLAPIKMTPALMISYMAGFATLTATIVHVALFYGPEIMALWRGASSLAVKEDIHEKLMQAYPEVPRWWYTLLFVVMAITSVVACEVGDYMPWWAVCLAYCFMALTALPAGIIEALTGQLLSLNILAQYIIGYILPGNAIASVTFKSYSYVGTVQTLSFMANLKLGHYMKIPPRTMFAAQIVATLVSSSVGFATLTWLMVQKDMCSEPPFTCPPSHVFYSAAIVWGAIGPARMFGYWSGGLYAFTQAGFLVGAALPLVFWLAARRWPKAYWLQYVHWPIIINVAASMPPYRPYYYTNGIAVALFFGYFLRKYRFQWWSRYNFVTAAAMDTGTSITLFTTFFLVQLREISMPEWAGNLLEGDCPLSSRNAYGE